jgi:hypothetical protein
MLRALPGVFCAGEMLDWEAPTGGYLLTACFATGVVAGRSAATFTAPRALHCGADPRAKLRAFLQSAVLPLEKILTQLATELKVRPAQIDAAVELLDGGATVPFIARYRKEATGGLDDSQLRELSRGSATCASSRSAAPRCSRASTSRAS